MGQGGVLGYLLPALTVTTAIFLPPAPPFPAWYILDPAGLGVIWRLGLFKRLFFLTKLIYGPGGGVSAFPPSLDRYNGYISAVSPPFQPGTFLDDPSGFGVKWEPGLFKSLFFLTKLIYGSGGGVRAFTPSLDRYNGYISTVSPLLQPRHSWILLDLRWNENQVFLNACFF